MVSSRGVVLPWPRVFEDTLQGVFRGNGNGNVQRENGLCVLKLSCVVIGDGAFYVSYVGNFFIVTNSMEPLWCGKVVDFCNPNFFAEVPNGCVEGGMPGREEVVFVAANNEAAEDEVCVGISPGV